jgi:glycerol-3-phosphate dehydrogenase (NAD(P)+)
MNVTVVGAGAWGTALAVLLHQNRRSVTLWGHDPAHLDAIRRDGQNERYLPGIRLPPELVLELDLNQAIAGADSIVIAAPSKVFRELTRPLNDYHGIVVSVTKGIEDDTGLTMCGILRENAPRARPAALSGPTFAAEIARGTPAAIVAASDDEGVSRAVQSLFHRPTFRVYTSTDLLGVELGGALKNVIAVAAGISDGLGFGDNSKAALVTRAIVEIRRLGMACGAHAETFAGLSGLGDLVVTCFSQLSRNRGLGERLGRGENLGKVLAAMTSVAEGYPTARSAFQLAQRMRVETPIINEVYAMLYEGKNLAEAVRDLITRDSKAEE